MYYQYESPVLLPALLRTSYKNTAALLNHAGPTHYNSITTMTCMYYQYVLLVSITANTATINITSAPLNHTGPTHYHDSTTTTCMHYQYVLRACTTSKYYEQVLPVRITSTTDTTTTTLTITSAITITSFWLATSTTDDYDRNDSGRGAGWPCGYCCVVVLLRGEQVDEPVFVCKSLLLHLLMLQLRLLLLLLAAPPTVTVAGVIALGVVPVAYIPVPVRCSGYSVGLPDRHEPTHQTRSTGPLLGCRRCYQQPMVAGQAPLSICLFRLVLPTPS